MKKFIIILFVVLFNTGASYSQVDFDTPVAKTYRLKYKKVEKILPLLRTIMSNKGVFQSSDEFNIFVLRDFPANLIQVDSLVAKFDVPLKQIFVSVRLLLGHNPDPNAVEEEVPTISDFAEVGEFLGQQYSFSNIIEVDRCFIRTEEKSRTSLELGSGNYNVSFEIDYITGDINLVKFRFFEISEVVSSVQGKYLKPLIRTSAEMTDGSKELLTVFKKEQSEKSLIVIVTVQSM